MNDSVVANGQETLDKIAFRIFQNNDDSVLKLFYRQNPHLHDLGLIIPVGTIIKIPFEINNQVASKKVRLWD